MKRIAKQIPALLFAGLFCLLSACGASEGGRSDNPGGTPGDEANGAPYVLTPAPEIQADSIACYASADLDYGFFVPERDGKYGLMDEAGTVLTEPAYGEPYLAAAPELGGKVALCFPGEGTTFAAAEDGTLKAVSAPEADPGKREDVYWMEGAPILLEGGVTDLHTVPFDRDAYNSRSTDKVFAFMRYAGKSRPDVMPVREITHLIGNYDNNYRTLTYVPGFKTKKYALFNAATGAVLCEYLYDEISPAPVDGVFAVRQRDKWGYVSEKGEVITECVFDPVHSHQEPAWSLEIGDYTVTRKDVFLPLNGYIVTMRDGKYGLMKSDGETVLENKYEYISQVNGNGVFWVKENGAWLRGNVN